jgi:biotin carboxylase
MGASVALVSESEPVPKVRDTLLAWQLANFDPDALDVDSVLTGFDGEPFDAVVALTERAVLPAALIRQSLGLTGNSVQTARRCRDKALMKEVVRDAGILCADWIEISADTEANEIIDRLGLPLVIKQRDSSGSRGTIVASTVQEVEDALQPGWMAEQFLGGEEMSVESIVYEGRARFINFTEYLKPGWANIVPADLGNRERSQLEAFNARVLDALDIEHGISHLEVFRTSNKIYFGEVAVRPPGGRLLELISRAYDFDAWSEVLRSQLKHQQTQSLPERAQRYAGIWFLHPGPGTVVDIQGLDAAAGTSGVTEVKCRVKPGEQLSTRIGTGQSIGHITAEATSRDALARALTRATSQISIKVSQ